MATFILGAGFSRPAGLPLGANLFNEILKLADSLNLRKFIDADIENFIHYKRTAEGKILNREEVGFEEFISFLDIEHFLGLNGSDTWSDEGNQTQMIVRNLIALSLYNHQARMTNEQWSLYEDFVDRLGSNDWIFTFNYDTIIEEALKRKNISYRLFPVRNKISEHDFAGLDDKDEIVVIKLHGSLNWFNSAHVQRYIEKNIKPLNIIFSIPEKFDMHKLVDDALPDETDLNNIYVVENMDKYFSDANFLLQCPLVISPSFNKMVYLNPLKDFWWGFNQMGAFVNKVVIIGFSLPEHDEYIRLPLYHLVNNYQYFMGDNSLIKKEKIKLVDYRDDEEGVSQYKKTYQFVDENKADYCFSGLNRESLNLIFKEK